MNFKHFFISIFILILAGCSSSTPIKDLVLPPVSTIEGTITQVDEGGFVLQDDSGSIYVIANIPGGEKLNLSLKEKVRVYGNLRGGTAKNFDGYVIKRETGEQIIVTNPKPHIGFIIQTSFKEE